MNTQAIEPKALRRSLQPALALILLLAVIYKAVWLALNAVPFNGDEGSLALMARNILQGERPVFLYNHAYLGSTGAWLTAFSFSIFGQSVLAIRLGQLALFAATLLTTYFVARRCGLDRWSASVAVLLLAIPPTMLVLYTTVTIGGYGETLLLGNVLLLVADRLAPLAHRGSQSTAYDRSVAVRPGPRASRLWLYWLLLGLISGFGFYTFSLFLVYLIPVGLGLLFHYKWSAWRGYAIGLIGFLIGSAPLWIASLQAGGALSNSTLSLALANLSGKAPANAIGLGLINFFVFGVSAFFGLRYPWSPDFSIVGLGVGLIYLAALIYAVRRASRILLGMFVVLLMAFIATPLGVDPSGRYLLPLYLPLAIFTAAFLSHVRENSKALAGLLLVFVLSSNAGATLIAAVSQPPGITTQFDAVTQIERSRDQELIDFLVAQHEMYGYSNWNVVYPIEFLSNARIIMSARLPYHLDLRYSPYDDRYAPYTQAVAQAPRAFYITTNHPPLNALIRSGLQRLQVTFREQDIGDYHIFYALSRKVEPEDIGLPGTPTP